MPQLRVGATVMGMLVLCAGCRFFPPNQSLDRKSASKLVRDVTVDSPWIRIPAGLPPSPSRDAKALRAYRQLATAGILRCDADYSECSVGPKGKDVRQDGTAGIRVTIGLLVASDVSVVRHIDENSASGTVTVRFRPAPVFSEFRAALQAILEAQGDTLAAEPLNGGTLARAQFHREEGKWHLEEMELLGNPGAAYRRAGQPNADPPSVAATNVAQAAVVQVSSEDTTSGHAGLNAIDGVVEGNPESATNEWFTSTEREGAWIKLTWPSPVQVWEVILHGRSSPDENVRSGTLTFSDGSSIGVGELRRDGSGLRVPFGMRTITWLQFQVTSAVGPRTGLAEIEVLGAPIP